nr:hypothetical protein [Tanacetum cinerariifolium]
MVIIVKDVLFSDRNLRKIFLHLVLKMEFSKILSSHPMTIPTLLMLLESHSLSIKTPIKIPHKVLHKSTTTVVTVVQYTVNHPIFNTQNDLFDSQNKLMKQLTSMCDMVGQFIQKNEEEKQIEEDQAANARYWKIPACYDDDDDDYAFAITPNEPDNSLKTHFVKRLLYDNSSPRPLKEFVSENSDAEIESFFHSPIPVEDSDTLMEEIDLSFTLDYPIQPVIEEDEYDSEMDILIIEELLSNNSLSLPKNESFHFDVISFSRPPAKPPDGNTGTLNVKMMGDISEQKVPMTRLMITLVPNQEKSPDLLSHQGLEIFQPSDECPMMIHGKNTPILDVLLFHFYPLNQFKYGAIGSSSAT